jgi:hypothetical protein
VRLPAVRTREGVLRIDVAGAPVGHRMGLATCFDEGFRSIRVAHAVVWVLAGEEVGDVHDTR